MSKTRSPFHEDYRDDGIATECWLCGGYISAGTYPDICKECLPEFELIGICVDCHKRIHKEPDNA